MKKQAAKKNTSEEINQQAAMNSKVVDIKAGKGKAKVAPQPAADPADALADEGQKVLPDIIETSQGKKLKLPKAKGTVALGKVADMLYERSLRMKEVKAAIEKQFGKELEKLQAEEKALEEYLINSVPKSLATGVAGQLCRVTVKTKEVPTVKDWDVLYKHIKKTGDFDLLGRSVSKTAVQQRWDANKAVPGIDKFNAVSLSVNKL